MTLPIEGMEWQRHTVLMFIIRLARSGLEPWHHLNYTIETIVTAPLVQREQCLSGTLDLTKQICGQALTGAVWTAGRTQILGVDISVASRRCSGPAKTLGGESPPEQWPQFIVYEAGLGCQAGPVSSRM